MSLILNYAVSSDRGLVRQDNEDSAYAGPHILVLADGMGGHAAGEIASQIMVNHMIKLDRDPQDNDLLALLGGYSDDANREIAQTVRTQPETEGMGTTLTSLLFNGTHFGLIHVGDSRGYRLRDGKLEQITVDDTFVQSLVEKGKLDPGDVSSHPQKALILKAYTGTPVEPSLRILDAKPGDRMLLCSDGLSDPVTASTIEEALRQGTPEIATQRLVELALRSGGPDNVTVVVADVLEDTEIDEKTRAQVPKTPVTAGALNGPVEVSHPDTAAGRAAALSRPAASAQPNKSVTVPPPAVDTFDEDEPVDDAEEGPRRGRWIGVIVALLVILGLIGGGWWLYSRMDDNYFLAAEEVDGEERFVIEQGVNFSVFGRDLHEPVQGACLNAGGDLRVLDLADLPAAGDDDCAAFGPQDLPESARAGLDALDGGSYEQVTQQLRNLAQQALPVCITVEPEDPDAETQTEAGAGDLAQPGVNCREV